VNEQSSVPEIPPEQPESPLKRRQAQKREAVESLVEIVESIAGERRELDEWEQTYLVRALASISSGCYVLAKTQAGLARATAEERSLKTDLPAKPSQHYNLAQIGLRLQEVASAPVLKSQNFDFTEQSDNSASDASETPDARSASASN
jgi:hypothetical protein